MIFINIQVGLTMLKSFKLKDNRVIELELDDIQKSYNYIKLKCKDSVVVLDAKMAVGFKKFEFKYSQEVISAIYLSENTTLNVEHDLCLAENLFAFDDKDYNNFFVLRRKRPELKALAHFAAKQMAINFPGSNCYKIGAAIIECYKAIELCDLALVRDCDERLSGMYLLLSGCEESFFPRESKEHLMFSLLCAHWHAKVMIGDYEGVLRVLEKVEVEARTVGFFCTAGYPVNLSFLLLAIIAKLTGDDEKYSDLIGKMHKVFHRMIHDYYVHSDVVRDQKWSLPKNNIWNSMFNEFAVSQSAISCGLELCKESKTLITKPKLLRKAFYRTLRVREEPAASLMYDSFCSFFK